MRPALHQGQHLPGSTRAFGHPAQPKRSKSISSSSSSSSTFFSSFFSAAGAAAPPPPPPPPPATTTAGPPPPPPNFNMESRSLPLQIFAKSEGKKASTEPPADLIRVLR